jgi:hypothetical protein
MTEDRAENAKPQTKLKESAADYVRAKQIPTFFGQPLLKGTYQAIDPAQSETNAPALY